MLAPPPPLILFNHKNQHRERFNAAAKDASPGAAMPALFEALRAYEADEGLAPMDVGALVVR